MTLEKNTSGADSSTEPEVEGRGRRGDGFKKALLLFLNFFLIITAYYQVKPASRTLFIEYFGSGNLPYIWVAAALVLSALAPFYNKVVARWSRQKVVVTSAFSFACVMLLFWFVLKLPSKSSVAVFYITIDIMSVALVEQFWSLSNGAYRTSEGKRWYGLIGSGGLLGGIAGGWLASKLIKGFSFKTIDLLLVCCLILVALGAMAFYMFRKGIFKELPPATSEPHQLQTEWEALRSSPYLIAITLLILISQVIEPVIEFQFMYAVESAFSTLDERTAYLSTFFSILGVVALGVNFLVTPLVYRLFGVLPGLLIQPLSILVSSLFYFGSASLARAAILKISDRSLSYSINRASKELLYLPLDPTLIHRAKVWVDMVGYRAFKIIGALLILLFTKWLPAGYALSAHELVWINVFFVAIWFTSLRIVHVEYAKLTKG